MIYLFFKRSFDILFSLFVLIFLSPFIFLILLIIFLQDGKPLIFKQIRIGMLGKKFTFYKFRSMPITTNEVVSTMQKNIKITSFGKLLRRTNMDELPQFYNVLKGEMSVIGPRPSIASQTNLIKLRKENGSINIRPGMTGWAQINSYDNMLEEKKAYYDGEYYRKMGVKLDTLIFFKTILYFTKKPPTY